MPRRDFVMVESAQVSTCPPWLETGKGRGRDWRVEESLSLESELFLNLDDKMM